MKLCERSSKTSFLCSWYFCMRSLAPQIKQQKNSGRSFLDKNLSCDKLCWEPCERPPCNEPCQQTLKKCGHPCIGLCGEPCPTKCRICDKDEVEEIFFGTEEEPEARFVLLLDCHHFFEQVEFDCNVGFIR